MATRNLGGQSYGRPSIAPVASEQTKARHLIANRNLQESLKKQLNQLSTNLAETESLLRMTSVQADAMQGLGSWHASLFMSASKILGEESVRKGS